MPQPRSALEVPRTWGNRQVGSQHKYTKPVIVREYIRFSLNCRDVRHKVHLMWFFDWFFVVELGAKI